MINIVIGLMCLTIMLAIAAIVISCKAKRYGELWVQGVVIALSIFNIVVLLQ